ncbi:MAG TPA: hypothetical protein PLB25_13280, partial [Rhodoferax sp.]|nr:hypothetical protein [Rhodoferax sp.]
MFKLIKQPIWFVKTGVISRLCLLLCGASLSVCGPGASGAVRPALGCGQKQLPLFAPADLGAQ